MDTSTQSIFTLAPHEILVDILLYCPTSTIINFYSINSTHLKLFDDQHGLWEQLARRIFRWGALETPVQGRHGAILKNNVQTSIEWKKEFRIASYIRDKLHKAKFIGAYRSQQVSIEKNQIKSLPVPMDYTKLDELCFAAVVQSDTILYPHPIGNFSTAYFEVEFLKIPPSFELQCTIIGGALEGSSSYVGSARSSYGISTVPDVFLECDFSMICAVGTAVEVGDTLGFGINFARNSLFFTKNGNLVYEATKSSDDQPLKNLKSLHATISLFQDEVAVNMGGHPFEFDLLKYQHSKEQPKMSLRLFSEIIVSHLIAVPDEEYTKKSPYYYTSDRNLPKPPFSLPSFCYLLSYGVPHPETRITIESQDLADLEYFRMILNSVETFRKLTTDEEIKQADKLLEAVAPSIEQQIPGFRTMPWLEKINVAENIIDSWFHERCLYFVKLHADELVELTFANYEWAVHLLAELEYFSIERPIDNGEFWTKAVMRRVLDPQEQYQTTEDFSFHCLMILLKLRLAGLNEMMIHRGCQSIAHKVDEYNIMKKISCEDKLLCDMLLTTVRNLYNKMSTAPAPYPKPSPFNVIFAQLIIEECLLACTKQLPAEDMSVVHQELDCYVVYGIFKLKLSPDNFSSKEEYLHAVAKENKKLITKELELKFFEETLKKLPTRTNIREAIAGGPLVALFGFKFDLNAPIEELKQEAERQLVERINSYRNDKAKKHWSTFGQTRTMFVGAAIAGLIGVAIGGYFLAKRKVNK